MGEVGWLQDNDEEIKGVMKKMKFPRCGLILKSVIYLIITYQRLLKKDR